MSSKRERTVETLLDAAEAQLRESGYDALTIRNVAARAGVAPATAYTYFKSKQHLVAEAYRRRIALLPTDEAGESPLERLRDYFDRVGALLESHPALASGATVAMLADQPEVREIQRQAARETRRRIAAALGDADPEVLTALDLTWAGLLISAGLGYVPHHQVGKHMSTVADLLMKGSRA